MGLQSSQTKYLCKYLFSILWDILRSRISESYGNSVSNSPTSPRVVYEGSNFSTSSRTLVITALYDYSHHRGKAVPCCDFDLCFHGG